MNDNLNEDYKKRDQIIFGHEVDWKRDEPCGGTLAFKELPVDKLRQLKTETFLDPNDKQNEAPSIKQFMEYMEKYPKVTAHGYAVSPKRSDYRISVEGLEFDGLCTTRMQSDFTKLCKRADEIEVTSTRLYCWYD